MKAVLLEATHKLTLTDVDPPTIQGADEVLINVKTVGICGSEVHAFNGTHPFRKPPCILGHEAAGQVVSVGSGVQTFKPGDRVCVDPQWTCGECEFCQSGDQQLCPSKKVLGTTNWPGAFGEYMIVPEQAVYRLPDHLSNIQGTLVEPLSVGVHANRRANIQAGESVAVLGAGPIGMTVTAVASTRGAAPIIVSDLQQHCLNISKNHLGATNTLVAGRDPLVDTIMNITEGKGVDVVFLTVGIPALFNEALKIVKSRGRIVLVALFEKPLQLEAFDIVGRDVSIVGSQMYNAADIRTAIDLIATGKVQLDAMVTHILPLSQAQHGFEMASTKTDGAVKVILTFDEDK